MKKHKIIAYLAAITLIIGIAVYSKVELRSTGEPEKSSDFREAILIKLLSPDELKSDQKRKLLMTKDELLWERKLEENLGDFYLPRYKSEKIAGNRTAWDYVNDHPDKPNVLIIGDSISRGYTVPIQDAFKGDADVFRAPENTGATENGLKKLDMYLEGDKKWDVIVFNFGIHDRRDSQEKYRGNLRQLVTRLTKTGAKLIWVNTTPRPPIFKGLLPDSVVALRLWWSYGRGMDEKQLNQIADAVMSSYEIQVVDIEQSLGSKLRQNQIPNDVHFPEPFYAEIAAPIVRAIRSDLDHVGHPL